MAYSLISHRDGDLLVIEIRDARAADNLEISAELRRRILEEAPLGVLIDIRGNSEYPTPVTSYNRISRQFEHVNQPTEIPFAIVDSGERSEDHSFQEDLVANRGYTLRFFHDVEPARAWLKQQIEPSR